MSIREPALWLNELSELSGRFKELLERELAHLSSWPVLNLPDFAQAKIQLSRKLEQLESERVQWLSSQGQHERGRLAMREALHKQPNGSQLLKLWEHAMGILQACQLARSANTPQPRHPHRQCCPSCHLWQTRSAIGWLFTRQPRAGLSPLEA